MSRKGRIECTIAVTTTVWDYLDDGMDKESEPRPEVTEEEKEREK
jgi:hypothetical protein